MEFDEAYRQIPDDSVDLPHIDGFYTYEAARYDYGIWLPEPGRHLAIGFPELG